MLDFHTHVFADKVAPRAINKLSALSKIVPDYDGTIDGLKAVMNNSGVDISVVLPIATKPEQVEKINDWALGINNEQIIAFGCMHPEYKNIKHELTRLKEGNIKGIKLHPDYQGIYADDERCNEIYVEAGKLGLIVLLHTGMDIGLLPPYKCTPRTLQRVVTNNPDTKFIAAHLAGAYYWDEVLNIRYPENLYLDTAYTFCEANNDTIRRIFDKFGYEKILFATDAPWKRQSEYLEKIESLGINNNEMSSILWTNGAKLLNIK